MPEITMEMVRAATTFKRHTAVGVDAVTPGQLGWLCDALLPEMARWFTALEEAGVWHEQAATAIVHLISKEAGGRHPVGILASAIRQWERVRRLVMQQWRRQVDRKCNWLAQGRGSERSVWAQTVHEEADKGRGEGMASMPIDLVNTLEQVILSQVWRRGVQHGMPGRILALALEAWSLGGDFLFGGA